MKSQNMAQWQKEKARDIFSLSHQMLSLMNQYYQFQLQETHSRVDFALDVTQHAINRNFQKIKEKQLESVVMRVSRLARYHQNIVDGVDHMTHKIESQSGEMIHASADMLASIIEESDKKLPLGTKTLADSVRAAAQLSDQAYKAGSIGAEIATENSKHFLNRYIEESETE